MDIELMDMAAVVVGIPCASPPMSGMAVVGSRDDEHVAGDMSPMTAYCAWKVSTAACKFFCSAKVSVCSGPFKSLASRLLIARHRLASWPQSLSYLPPGPKRWGALETSKTSPPSDNRKGDVCNSSREMYGRSRCQGESVDRIVKPRGQRSELSASVIGGEERDGHVEDAVVEHVGMIQSSDEHTVQAPVDVSLDGDKLVTTPTGGQTTEELAEHATATPSGGPSPQDGRMISLDLVCFSGDGTGMRMPTTGYLLR